MFKLDNLSGSVAKLELHFADCLYLMTLRLQIFFCHLDSSFYCRNSFESSVLIIVTDAQWSFVTEFLE